MGHRLYHVADSRPACVMPADANAAFPYFRSHLTFKLMNHTVHLEKFTDWIAPGYQ